MADNERDARLRIRATDETSAAAKSAAGNVDKVTSALTKQSDQARKAADSSAAFYNRISEELREAQQEAVEARQKFEAFFEKMSGGEKVTRQQEKAWDALGRQMDTADKRVAKLAGTLDRADTAFRNNIARMREADASASYVRDLTQEIEKAAAAQERLDKLSAFRKLGADAETTAHSLESFSRAATQAGASSNQVASGLLGIIDPARQARGTLDGLEQEFARLDAVIGDGQRPLREYGDAINDLERAKAALLRQGELVDSFRQQAAVVRQTEAAVEDARERYLALAAAVRAADEPNEALAGSLKRAETALTAANRELATQRTRLAALKAPLDAAKIDTDDLAAAQARLQASANLAATATDRLDRAFAGTNTRAGRFLGLKPYEIQNLGFQINDVFTQIASGTSVTQTFAQQGGQILQIFPGLFAQIARFFPLIALGVGALATAGAALRRETSEAASVKEFGRQLELTADAAQYSAAQLGAQAAELDKLGLSTEDARKSVSAFVKEGLDTDQFEAFAVSAKQVADLMGMDVPEAAAKLAESFSGGYEQVVDLDDALNFLTLAEREHIEAMFESGDAAGARTEAFRIFQERAQEVADLSDGNWSQAARNIADAWSAFLDKLGDTRAVQDAIRALNNLAEIVKMVTNLLPGGSTAGVAGTAQERIAGRANARITELQRERSILENANGVMGFFQRGQVLRRTGMSTTGEIDAEIARQKAAIQEIADAGRQASEQRKKDEADLVSSYQDETNALKGVTAEQKAAANARRLAKAEEEGRARAAAAGLDNEAIARVALAARAAEQAKIDEEATKASIRAGKAAESAQRKAEAAARQRLAVENQLLNMARALEVRVAKTQQSSLEGRLAAIDTEYAKVFDKIAEFEAEGGSSVDGLSIGQYRARIEAGKEILRQQETLAYFQDSISTLEDQREDRLRRIADLQAEGRLSSAEAFAEAQAVQSELGPAVEKMARDAITFARAIGGANPPPELQAFINAMERATGGTARDVRATGGALLKDEEQALNATLQERNALVAANNELAKAGLITEEEARRRSEEAYNAVAPRILLQVEKQRELVEALRAQGIITEQVYGAWIAKLQLVAQETEYVDALWVELTSSINEALTGGLVDLFDGLTTTLGQLVDGSLTFGEAIQNAGNLFRQFAADFLRQIAQMIIQQAILNALSGAGEGGGVGGTIANAIIGVVSRHEGGLVNSRGPMRRLPAALFASAPRYHTGTVGVGLSHDEQAAVLKKGEEVLTENDPRHMKNWGGGAPVVVKEGDIKIVNTLDPAEFIEKGLATHRGQRAITNFMRANPSAVRAATGAGGGS